MSSLRIIRTSATLLMLVFVLLSISFDVEAADKDNCLMCHKYRFLGRIDETGKTVNYNVDQTIFTNTVHKNVSCRECHTYIKKVPHDPVTEQVNSILDSIARFNKARLFLDGYSIQVYAGMRRDEAMNVIKKIKDELSELTPDLKYEQPKFRVKAGSYFSRLEAQRDLRRVKQYFPTAILVPDKVPLK